jgi:hypothetical protein
MGLSEAGTETFTLVTSHYSPSQNAPASSPNNTKSSFSLSESLLRKLCGLPLPPSTSSLRSRAGAAGPENAFNSATGSDRTIFPTIKDRSPVSHRLSPIVTSADVFQFLKRAEIHAGLLSTQLLDLCWVLDSLFNVHDGVQFLFTLTSKDWITMIIKIL